MRNTYYLGSLIVITFLILVGCGPSPYQDLQSKIATVDSVLVKGKQQGVTNIDSLMQVQQALAVKYTKNLDPEQVPDSDLFAAAQLYYIADRNDLAIQVMERKDLEQANTNFTDLLFQLYFYEDRIEKADSLFHQYIMPNTPEDLADYFEYLQWGYIETSQYDKALVVVDEAIEALAPEFTVSLEIDKAELHFMLGDTPTALAILDQVETRNDLTDKNRKKLAAKRQLYSFIGKPAPELTVDDWLGADPTTLADLKGHVILLDFWAPWCGPCRAILPFIQKLYDEHRDEGLRVIGVTQYYGRFNQLGQNLKGISPDEEIEWVEKFKKANAITIPTAISMPENGAANAALYGVYGIPHMVLIDREGKVRYYTIGSGKSSEETLKSGVLELLGENS